MRRSVALIPGPQALTRRQIMLAAAALSCSGVGIRAASGAELPAEGIARSAESIHQEPVIAASRQRVYAVLTDARQFDRLTLLSDAGKSMTPKPPPARINARPGGEFALFGGYISGRFIEMVANELIVQAWRVGNWNPGIYSIARFQLIEQGASTRISFDHTGFPAGNAEHLAEGWHSNYWDPLQKLLS
ncbi:MAG: SRPBCC domain-containing protein [Steroidobacteraceae bacterium]|jgi:activator of HSP90 ATPase